MNKEPTPVTLKSPEKLTNYIEKSAEKKEAWVKSQTPSESEDKNNKIKELIKETEDVYPPEPVNRLKTNTPEANRPSAIYPVKKENRFKALLKKAGIFIGLVGTTAAAVGQQGPNINQKDDIAFANTYKVKGNETNRITENEPKIDLSKAREMTPELAKKLGYREYSTTKDGRTYLIKEESSKGSNIVKPVNHKKKIHPTTGVVKQFKYSNVAPKSNKSVDIVYFDPVAEVKEKIKEVDPYAAYAIKGEGIYLPGVSGHNAGQMYYLSMKSKNAYESGMTNTANEPFVIRLEDPNGNSLGKTVQLNSIEDRNKYLDVSGRHLNPEKFEELMKLAETQMELIKNQNKTINFNNNADLARLNK